MRHDEAPRSERLGHVAQRVAIGAGVGAILADLAWALIGPGDTVFALAATGCTLVFVLGIVAASNHDPAECLACIGAFPLEHIDAVVERHMPSLRGFHLMVELLTSVMRGLLSLWWWLRRGRARTSYNVPLGVAVMVVWFPLTAASFLIPRPWGSIAMMTTMVWFLTVCIRHRRLAPWCPWCRSGGGGGGGEEAPDPDPADRKQINA